MALPLSTKYTTSTTNVLSDDSIAEVDIVSSANCVPQDVSTDACDGDTATGDVASDKGSAQAPYSELKSLILDNGVQFRNGLRALQAEQDRGSADLYEEIMVMKNEIKSLHRHCQGLEDKVKALKQENVSLRSMALFKTTSSLTPLSPSTIVLPPSTHSETVRQPRDKNIKWAEDDDPSPPPKKIPSVMVGSTTPPKKIPTIVSNCHYSDYLPASSEVRKPREQEEAVSDLPKRPALKIPLYVKNILIGDSNLMHVNRKKLDPSGKTAVRTCPSATMSSLSSIVEGAGYFPGILKVVLHVGTCDIRKNMTSAMLVRSFIKLLQVTREHFPNARVSVFAIPPCSGPTVALKMIQNANKELEALCLTKEITFVKGLWDITENEVDTKYLCDKIHYSDRGLSVVIRAVKTLLNPAYQFKSQQHVSERNRNPHDQPPFSMKDFPPLSDPSSSPTQVREHRTSDTCLPVRSKGHPTAVVTNCTTRYSDALQTDIIRDVSNGHTHTNPNPHIEFLPKAPETAVSHPTTHFQQPPSMDMSNYHIPPFLYPPSNPFQHYHPAMYTLLWINHYMPALPHTAFTHHPGLHPHP